MRKFAIFLVLLLLLPTGALAQTVRLQDGIGTNRATVNADGSLKVDTTGSPTTGQPANCTTTAIVNQAASAQVIAGTANTRIYICAVILVSAGAQNVSVVEGTGAVCATGITGMIGGTAGSVALAANGGFAGVAAGPWISTATAANNVCVIQSAANNVSGTITYRRQ